METARGYRIQGTPQHRVKVVDPSSGAWEWKRFADVADGDLVPLALNQLVGEPQTVPLPPLAEAYWTGEHHVEAPRRMTPELAELLGYFMGDGSLHSRGLRFCVADTDFDVVERLERLGKEVFHVAAAVTPKTGYTEVAFHSVRLVLWWEACGFAKRAPSEGHAGKGYTRPRPGRRPAQQRPRGVPRLPARALRGRRHGHRRRADLLVHHPRLRRRRAERPPGARVPHHPLGRRHPHRLGHGADRGAQAAERLVRPAVGGRDRVPRGAQERRRHLERGHTDGPARLRPAHPWRSSTGWCRRTVACGGSC